ncbi:hypothetical protein [Actinomadura litoris]|nr:hypothetical protein [Actinomadura litoris]
MADGQGEILVREVEDSEWRRAVVWLAEQFVQQAIGYVIARLVESGLS